MKFFSEEEKEEKEKEENGLSKKMEENKGQTVTEKKKNVFAKFKSYNKDTVATKSMAAPPKNSIPNKPVTNSQDEKIILKDNANRYTFEGKLSNFNFLKKVDRKKVDKKYALTFADFKKMINNK